ncbi:hypothetical protein TraAM80_10063 [Trypanosoma rangeli]|uniref:Uncharacterized protein n=1 Tax=Trypanosoma rangeli TaxID=5698 RepID=A0A422MRP3_TRYRA|nr:uncharacterized protein TraAM80_10063 [Trypanosoma rangeli]RNE95864.1 hypothetical protein TraAM80_10063 [Trypanosoma rangeli]|eukprot:RNE95864.1 hypothetical protein TraAM80_10063 [Trypanosoma rangeli]
MQLRLQQSIFRQTAYRNSRSRRARFVLHLVEYRVRRRRGAPMPHPDAVYTALARGRARHNPRRVSLFRPQKQRNRCQAEQALARCPDVGKRCGHRSCSGCSVTWPPKRAGKRSVVTGAPPVPTRERFVRANVDLHEVLVGPLCRDIQASPAELSGGHTYRCGAWWGRCHRRRRHDGQKRCSKMSTE